MAAAAARLRWPAGGIPIAQARRAARVLARHLRAPEEGELDPTDVAAAVGAEQLAGLARSGTALAADVGRMAEWLESGEGEPPHVDHEVALTTAEALEQIAVGIIQQTRGRPTDAATVNVQAGHHLVVTDGLLVRAAVRAGHRSLADAPYYELRYGRRGRRFTCSDSAWLVTLPTRPDDAAREQVRWLAGVLATRGMPSLLLESHLDVLADELAAVTGSAARWSSLRDRAEELAEVRRRVVADVVVEGADDRLAALLAEAGAGGAGGVELAVPGAGRLVVGAVADAAAGLAEDIEPCVGWLADPDRFPAAWCRAVRSLARSLSPA